MAHLRESTGMENPTSILGCVNYKGYRLTIERQSSTSQRSYCGRNYEEHKGEEVVRSVLWTSTRAHHHHHHPYDLRSPLSPLSPHVNFLQPPPAHTKPLQPLPAHTRPLQPPPAHTTLLQPPPAHTTLLQPQQAHFEPRPPPPAHTKPKTLTLNYLQAHGILQSPAQQLQAPETHASPRSYITLIIPHYTPTTLASPHPAGPQRPRTATHHQCNTPIKLAHTPSPQATHTSPPAAPRHCTARLFSTRQAPGTLVSPQYYYLAALSQMSTLRGVISFVPAYLFPVFPQDKTVYLIPSYLRSPWSNITTR